MIKSIKNKKKKGFTLVELIAVIAIIGILAAVIVPMVGKYTTQAKMSKAKEEMRQYVMSVETAAADLLIDVNAIAYDLTVEDAKAITTGTADEDKIAIGANEVAGLAKLKMIQKVSYKQCKKVLEGVDEDWKLNGDVVDESTIS
ncbi:MAG: pilin [Clostridium sp.]